MKKWFIHILLLAGLFGTLTTSCSQEVEGLEEVPVTRGERLQVYFTLNLGEEDMQSRTWEGYDKDDANAKGEEGEGMETAVNDIQVLLFANNDANTFLGKVSVTMLTPETASHLYTFYGELPSIPSGYSIMDANNYLDCKLMILANCPEVTGLTPGTSVIASDVLKNITYNFNGTTPDEIPMWGILKAVPADGIKMQEGSYPNPLPDIYLLRAMAKVEVIMQAEDHEISSIAIDRYNNTGFCIPKGYNTADNTKALSRSGSFNATTSVVANQIPFINNVSEVTIDSEDYKCYTIYVPEYKNMEGTTAVTNPSSIVIKLDNKDKEYRINYGTNGKKTEWNIVRNHIYRYNITKVNDGAELELTLVVNPWNVDEENIQFTNEILVHDKMEWTGSYVTPNTEDGSILYINGSTDASTAATATFQIDTPVGATWYASFEGDKDAFYFLDEDDNKVTSVTGEVGSSATLRIVTAEEHVGEMKSVSLMIVVRTMDGRTIMVNKDLMPEALKDKDYFQLRQNLSI